MALVTLGRTDEVPEGEARRFIVGNRMIAVVNMGNGEFRAVGDLCSHAEAYLHEGEVDIEDRWIECPRHGSVFDLDTGDPLNLPATMPVPSYKLKIEDDEIKVEI